MPDTPIACEAYQEDFSALIDGELSSQREAELRGHLGACTGCSQRLEEFRGVDRALAGVALPEIPIGLQVRLQQQIQSIPEREVAARTRPAPPRGRRRFVGPAVGAALAVAAAVAVYLAVAPEQVLNPAIEELRVAVDHDPAFDSISVEEPAVAEETEVAMEPELRVEAESSEEGVNLEETVAAVDTTAELEAASVEELAVVLQLDTIRDLDVIANLEMLELLMAVEEGAS